MERKIAEGTHKTSVKNWGIRETKKGGLQIYIGFAAGMTFFQNVGMNETGDKIAAEALALCGFKGKDLPDLYDDDALDKNLDVEVYVKYKPNPETGEEQMQVYINNPNKKEMPGKVDKKQLKNKLKSLEISLKSDIKEAQESIILPKKSTPTKQNTIQDSEGFNVEEEDLPF